VNSPRVAVSWLGIASLENQNFALQRQVDRLTKDNRALDVARAELQTELEQAQEQINREKYNLQSEQVSAVVGR